MLIEIVYKVKRKTRFIPIGNAAARLGADQALVQVGLESLFRRFPNFAQPEFLACPPAKLTS